MNLEKDVVEQDNVTISKPEKLQELLTLHTTWLNSVKQEMGKE